MGGSFRGLGTAIAGLGLGFLIKDLAETSMKFDAIKNTLKAVTGTTEGAGREFEFVRSESKRLGLELTSTGQAYGKFAASANTSGLAAADTKKIFSSVAEASTVLGLSAEETSGTLYALGQMMNKGKITAEDYRGQFGERIPGAMGLLARAAGKTTAELDEMFMKGQLGIDLLPKLADELRKTFSPGLEDAIHGSRAAFNRFTNALTEAKVLVATGFMDQLAGGATKLEEKLSSPGFRNSLESLGKMAGKTIQIIISVSGGAISFFEDFGRFLGESAGRRSIELQISEKEAQLKALTGPRVREPISQLDLRRRIVEIKELKNILAGTETPISQAELRRRILAGTEIPQLPKPSALPPPPPDPKTIQAAIDKQVKIEQEMASIHQRFLESRGMEDDAALAEIERRFNQEEAAAKKLFTSKEQLETALHELDVIRQTEIQNIGKITADQASKNNDEMMNRFNEAGDTAEAAEKTRMENLLAFYEETGMERLANELRLEEERDQKLGEIQERFIMGQIDSWEDFERQRSEITTTFTKRIQKVSENAMDTTVQQIEDTRSAWGGALDWISGKAPETGKMLRDSAVSTLGSIKKAASDLFFDFFTGELKSLQDVFQRTFRFMLRIVTDVMAEIAVQVIIQTGIIKRLIEKLSKIIDDIFKKKPEPVFNPFMSIVSSAMKATAAVLGLAAAMRLVGNSQGGGGGGGGIFGGGIFGGTGGGGIFGGGGTCGGAQ